MTLIIGAHFKEEDKKRIMMIADCCEESDNFTFSTKKIYFTNTGIMYGLAGYNTPETEFLNKTAKDLNQCNSLDDVYTLFAGKYMVTFKGKELQVLFAHYKDSRLLLYEPPEKKGGPPELRWEKTYWVIGAAADLIHPDFIKTYNDNDWWDNPPSKNELIELMLDIFYKISNAKKGEVNLPLNIVCTNSYEKSRIREVDKEWQDTVKRVTNKMKIKGTSLDNIIIDFEHDFKQYEKSPEPKKEDKKEQKSKP